MPLSGSTTIWRLASVFSVGSLSGVPALRVLAQPARPIAISNARLWLGRIMFRIAREVGAVIELGHREAGLRGVDGQAFLLAGEFGDGHVLHDPLLFVAERGHARDQCLDAAIEIGNAGAEGVEAGRL